MSYPSFTKCKINAGVFWLFAVLKDTTLMAGAEGKQGGRQRKRVGFKGLCTWGGGGRRVSEWRNSGHPGGSPVSGALVCGQGPHSVLRGRGRTVLVQKSVSEVLVRMLLGAVSQAVRREGCIVRSVETLGSGTNILGLMCACSTGRISAMRETVAVREAPCTPTQARTS